MFRWVLALSILFLTLIVLQKVPAETLLKETPCFK